MLLLYNYNHITILRHLINYCAINNVMFHFNLFFNILSGNSGDHNLDEIIYCIKFDNYLIVDYMNNINNFDSLYYFYKFVGHKLKCISNPKMRWIPYFQIENLIEIAEGGFYGVPFG